VAFELPDLAPERPDFYREGQAEAAFRELRARDPLHWHAAGGFWCVTRHADVQYISQRPRLFSSEQGTQLFEVVGRNAATGAVADIEAAMAETAPSIIRMDPPRHNRTRRLVIEAFKPRRIAAMEDRVRAIARRSLEAIDPAEVCDFVEQVAVPMPMFVIAELLGVPEEDHEDFRRWSDAMVEAGGGQVSPETAVVVGELVQYFLRIAERRRRRPRSDVISVLVHADLGGRPLRDPELGIFFLTLLVAGNETTRNLIAGGALALLRNPAQRQLLLEQPGLLPGAIEEMLRYVSPVRNFVRCATRDLELRGKKLRRGDYLALLYGSANRDEEVFGPDAEEFDITRESARRHLAFGFGEHLCLGASLARLEARVLFEELLARWPRFELAGEPEPLPSSLMNGLVHMPVSLEP